MKHILKIEKILTASFLLICFFTSCKKNDLKEPDGNLQSSQTMNVTQNKLLGMRLSKLLQEAMYTAMLVMASGWKCTAQQPPECVC